MKIDPESKELERELFQYHKIYTWNPKDVEIKIQQTMEKIINRRVKTIIDNAI